MGTVRTIMAMPDNALSMEVIKGHYIGTNDIAPSKLVAYELGGIGLNDPSQGLMVQLWKVYARDTKVFITSELHPSDILLFERGDIITEVSLAFDQNMRPFVAFVQGEGELATTWFWWYDTAVSQQVFTQLVDARSPRATLDDKRKMQSLSSDIILAYVKNNNLYMRQQRERFEVEYLLYEGINGSLVKVGMSDKNRVQFLLDSSLV